jgi:hypothetical protein
VRCIRALSHHVCLGRLTDSERQAGVTLVHEYLAQLEAQGASFVTLALERSVVAQIDLDGAAALRWSMAAFDAGQAEPKDRADA